MHKKRSKISGTGSPAELERAVLLTHWWRFIYCPLRLSMPNCLEALQILFFWVLCRCHCIGTIETWKTMSKCDFVTNYHIILTEWVRNSSEACLVSLLSHPYSWVESKILSEVGSYYFLSDEIDQRIFLRSTASRQGAEWGKIRVSMTCLRDELWPWNCG